jgi:hypothetical protein
MSQESLTVSFSQEQLTRVDTALTDIETQFAGLVALDPMGRRRLTKMGSKSEMFCRNTMSVLAENPQLVAPGLQFPSAQANLASIDQLRSRLVRVRRLAERMVDTEMALGSSVMNVSLKGYAQIKLLGKSQGLDAHRAMLMTRFNRVVKKPEEAETKAA